ncbi:hypothetical protein [Blastomonas sp.]|uniref:hypothetical protein n=1 Tax=Blastomonas sp. TaxID=1909299 RepID=UPI0035930678
MKTIMTATAAALSVAALSSPALAGNTATFQHEVAVTHGDRAVTAVYQPRTTVSHRQIGNMTPNRPNTARCLWSATVMVERHLQQPAGAGSHVVRTLVPAKVLEGQTNGRCAAGEKQFSKSIAKRDDEVRAHVLAVAAEDHNNLMAELSAGSMPSS